MQIVLFLIHFALMLPHVVHEWRILVGWCKVQHACHRQICSCIAACEGVANLQIFLECWALCKWVAMWNDADALEAVMYICDIGQACCDLEAVLSAGRAPHDDQRFDRIYQFVEEEMAQAKSVRLSDINSQQWDTIRRRAGRLSLLS